VKKVNRLVSMVDTVSTQFSKISITSYKAYKTVMLLSVQGYAVEKEISAQFNLDLCNVN
jgi:hypothetical protein